MLPPATISLLSFKSNLPLPVIVSPGVLRTTLFGVAALCTSCNVAPAAMFTPATAANDLVIASVPAFTLVAPEYVLELDNVTVPDPFLTSGPVPPIAPLTVSTALLFASNVPPAPLTVTGPAKVFCVPVPLSAHIVPPLSVATLLITLVAL